LHCIGAAFKMTELSDHFLAHETLPSSRSTPIPRQLRSGAKPEKLGLDLLLVHVRAPPRHFAVRGRSFVCAEGGKWEGWYLAQRICLACSCPVGPIIWTSSLKWGLSCALFRVQRRTALPIPWDWNLVKYETERIGFYLRPVESLGYLCLFECLFECCVPRSLGSVLILTCFAHSVYLYAVEN
jgi:hypothetical protein